MGVIDLDLDLLRCFVAVAETGSFTLAGDIVGRTQSAVSQRVKRLEDIVQSRLVDRDSRMLQLTRDGENMLNHAKQMILYNDRAVRKLAEPASGTLRLGLAEDFIAHHLPRLIARFKAEHPNVTLEIEIGMSCALTRAFDRGDLDLVVAKKDGNAKKGRVIWHEPLVWVCGQDFDFRLGDPVPLVLLPPPCTYRAIALETLNAAQLPFVVACNCDSLQAIQAAIESGIGIAILGSSFVRSGLKVLSAAEGLPFLPTTEISLLGEGRADAALALPLVRFVVEELSISSRLALPLKGGGNYAGRA